MAEAAQCPRSGHPHAPQKLTIEAEWGGTAFGVATVSIKPMLTVAVSCCLCREACNAADFVPATAVNTSFGSRRRVAQAAPADGLACNGQVR
jgi:hypothetical protein